MRWTPNGIRLVRSFCRTGIFIPERQDWREVSKRVRSERYQYRELINAAGELICILFRPSKLSSTGSEYADQTARRRRGTQPSFSVVR